MMRRTAFITAIVIVLTTLAACSKPLSELSVPELLDLGEKYLLEMDYEQALVQFLKVIEVEPMNPRGYTGAAEAYVGLGEINKAIEVLESGLRQLPDNIEILESLDNLKESVSATTQIKDLLPESEPVPMQELEPFEESFFDTYTVVGTLMDYEGSTAEIVQFYRERYGDDEAVGVAIPQGISFSEPIVLPSGEEVDRALLSFIFTSAESNRDTIFGEPLDILDANGNLHSNPNIYNHAFTMTGVLSPTLDYAEYTPRIEGSSDYTFTYNPWGPYTFAIISVERKSE